MDVKNILNQVGGNVHWKDKKGVYPRSEGFLGVIALSVVLDEVVLIEGKCRCTPSTSRFSD